MMNKTIDTQHNHTTIFNFDSKEILKYVFAQNALHTLGSSAEEKHPHFFTEDNSELLETILKNGYFNISAKLLGYIAGYDFDAIDNGFFSLEIILPRTHDVAKTPLLHRKIEYTLATYVLMEIYDTEHGSKELAALFTREYRKAVNEVMAFFALACE